MASFYTQSRTSNVHFDWQPGSSPTLLFGMWHKIHLYRLMLVNTNLEIEKHQRILFFVWLTHTLDFIFLWWVKCSGNKKHFKKRAHIQAGSQMKTSQACISVKSQIDILTIRQFCWIGLVCVWKCMGNSGHINKTGLNVAIQCYLALSATKEAWEDALQIMVVVWALFKGHIIAQVVLCLSPWSMKM